MRKIIKFGISGIVCSLFFITSGNAQTNIPLSGTTYGVGIRALGMGGAFIGIADDYSATYWNPAGLGLIRRMELTGSFSSLFYNNDTEFFDRKESQNKNFTNLNTVGFVMPIPTYRGSLVFAVGYNKVANYNSIFSLAPHLVTMPPDTFTEKFDEFQEGGLNQFVFAGSIQMSENLFLGGSINIWSGKNNYSFEKLEEDVLDIYFESQWLYIDQIDTRINGFNLTLSTLYNLNNRFRFGVKVETPFTFTGKEDWSSDSLVVDDGSSSFVPMNDINSGEYEYKIKQPLTVSAGASLSLPLLTVDGDVAFTDWSQVEYKNPDDDPYLISENRNFRKNLEATMRYRLGAELLIPLLSTRVRAGYMFIPNPYTNGMADYSDKHFLTAGAGILLDRQFTLDAAVVHGWWDYIGPDNYSESITTFNYFVSASFRF